MAILDASIKCVEFSPAAVRSASLKTALGKGKSGLLVNAPVIVS